MKVTGAQALFKALERGWPVEQLYELTHIDPWFLQQFSQIAELRRTFPQCEIVHSLSD